MENKYSNSIITSSLTYIKNLQYLAKDDNKTLEDIFTLDILNNIYEWGEWFNISELDKIKLQKKMNYIINCNINLEIINNTPFKYYKNVSIPQTIWDWQRIYDNLNVNEINEL